MGVADKLDADLAVAAAGGDERAFAELMRRYKQPIYRYISRSMRSSEDAYDVLQETFTAAWRSMASYDASRKFSSWLYKIALNNIRDDSRRRTVRKFFFNAAPIDLPDRPDFADNAVSIESEYAHREELAAVLAMIDRLPEKLKQAFTLQVLNELSQSEVADILGVTTKTVETRVYRARKRLQEELNEQN